jgi:hypothetical protein
MFTLSVKLSWREFSSERLRKAEGAHEPYSSLEAKASSDKMQTRALRQHWEQSARRLTAFQALDVRKG